jgi:hypothetical protein
MPEINYNNLKSQLDSGDGFSLSTSDGGVPSDQSNPIALNIPTIPKIEFPLEDLSFQSTLSGKASDLNKILGLKDADGGKANSYAGSQAIINSDRIILNSRVDYLMLFGQQGVAISSQGNVNIDADDAITLYGDDGLFLGVPGKGKSIEEGNGNSKAPKNKAEPTLDSNYEPLLLGIKVANLIEDLLITIKNMTVVTPVGYGYLREDVMYDLACLQARIPEMLSTYGFIDGISHEAPDPAPTAPKTLTAPSTNVTGTVTGTVDGSLGVTDNSGASSTITNTSATQDDFFNTQNLYNNL